MKLSKTKVIKGLTKLRQKMLDDAINWAHLYDESGAANYLVKHGEECFTIPEIMSGKVSYQDIQHQMDYINDYVDIAKKK